VTIPNWSSDDELRKEQVAPEPAAAQETSSTIFPIGPTGQYDLYTNPMQSGMTRLQISSQPVRESAVTDAAGTPPTGAFPVIVV
jgi:hypothetical protein